MKERLEINTEFYKHDFKEMNDDQKRLVKLVLKYVKENELSYEQTKKALQVATAMLLDDSIN
ncbi:hypothetical protein ATO21_01070 [Pediococcus acidilactici]|uniref:hypothetical protein n=1 Tax=Pediococcus acidilactici TaxID=1254 RepID=UPI00071AF48A|nr:hypothetical protein [Pediococcus acidilactici]KSV57205.1 hypothetical protein ATO21_01070 [Pediococcus acidilactici]RWY86329.1 hypothetical protein EQG54_06060 [Pediococcus acidilactici]